MAQPHWQLDADRRTATRVSDVPLALASFAKSYVSSRAADAALAAGACGVLVNVGGDAVVRGALSQTIQIADPNADAENDLPLDRISVRDRAVATSGSYRRGVALGPSHILDPRTARPTSNIISSTVIAEDAETAGALATAFSVLSPVESAALAARTPGVDYLLVTAEGQELRSAGWSSYQLPGLRRVSYTAAVPHASDAGVWNPAFELMLGFDLPHIEDARYRRPYLAVWIEDADHFPVRTLALWTQNPRWLPELKQWFRDDQIRNLSEGTDISKNRSPLPLARPAITPSSGTARTTKASPSKPASTQSSVEASREHGGYQIERHEMNFDCAAAASQASLPAGKELGDDLA